jgi:hypothetical protein
MQLVIIIFGAVLGLTYGAYYDGFVFSSKICLFAGLTLIMPSLFKVKFSDVNLLWPYRVVIIKSLFINYLLLPIFAVAIGLITQDFGIAAGLFLLSVLSGGGMVMHWIKKSGADTSLGFLLLFINLLLVSLSLLMLHTFGIYTSEYFDVSYVDETNVSNFAKAVLILLIVVPFITIRLLLFVKPLVIQKEKYISYISSSSIFIILVYLFGLQSSQHLFDLYDFEPELFYISVIAVFTFYLLTLVASKLIFDLDSKQERAAFWHSVTRYITLALVISTFTTNTFGVSMLLPVMLAYVIQIPFAIFIDKKLTVKV